MAVKHLNRHAPVAVVHSFPRSSFASQCCRSPAAAQRVFGGGARAHVTGGHGQLSSTWNGTLLLLTGPASCWYMRV